MASSAVVVALDPGDDGQAQLVAGVPSARDRERSSHDRPEPRQPDCKKVHRGRVSAAPTCRAVDLRGPEPVTAKTPSWRERCTHFGAATWWPRRVSSGSGGLSLPTRAGSILSMVTTRTTQITSVGSNAVSGARFRRHGKRAGPEAIAYRGGRLDDAGPVCVADQRLRRRDVQAHERGQYLAYIWMFAGVLRSDTSSDLERFEGILA